jgi:geranylgeranyl pyrophosphate synthase
VTPSELEDWLAECRARVDETLDKFLPPADEPPAALHEAMRYAVFSDGKRLRPALAFGAAQACGAPADRVLSVAAAAELVHAYSLVHDDLPAMDDDDLRRGRPSVHVRYGEAEAVLAGDALLPAGFALLAQAEAPPCVVARLAHAAGSRALVGGQSDDLRFDAAAASAADVRSIHRRKTAALFAFAVCGAAEMCGASAAQIEGLERFADAYGLAFQAVDDLLDRDADECSLLAVLDEPAIRSEIGAQTRAAEEALAPFGASARALRGLASTVAGRLP